MATFSLVCRRWRHCNYSSEREATFGGLVAGCPVLAGFVHHLILEGYSPATNGHRHPAAELATNLRSCVNVENLSFDGFPPIFRRLLHYHYRPSVNPIMKTIKIMNTPLSEIAHLSGILTGTRKLARLLVTNAVRIAVQGLPTSQKLVQIHTHAH